MSHKHRWYNTISGISKYCENLVDFHKILDTRLLACYDNEGRKQPVLDSFVVRGKWMLDEFGQITTVSAIRFENDYTLIDKDKLPEFPLVIPLEDFGDLIVDHLKPKVRVEYSFGGSPTPASIPSGSLCKTCQQEITIENSDTVIYGERHDFDKETAESIIGDLSSLSIDEIEIMLCEHYHTHVHVFPKDMKDKTSNNFDYYIVQDLVHRHCHSKAMTESVRERFTQAVKSAGLESYGCVRVKNEYGSEGYRGPWFLFDTSIGDIKLGWRKSVINIDYTGIDGSYTADTKLTFGPGYEHVNDYVGLSNALERFANHLLLKY